MSLLGGIGLSLLGGILGLFEGGLIFAAHAKSGDGGDGGADEDETLHGFLPFMDTVCLMRQHLFAAYQSVVVLSLKSINTKIIEGEVPA